MQLKLPTVLHQLVLRYLVCDESITQALWLESVEVVHLLLRLKIVPKQHFEYLSIQAIYCKRGYLEGLQYLQQIELLQACNFELICGICFDGHMHIIQYLLQHAIITKEDMRCNQDALFYNLCRLGNVSSLSKFIDWNIWQLEDLKYHAAMLLRITCETGYIPIFAFFWEKDVFNAHNLHEHNNMCFNMACFYGHHDLVRHILELNIFSTTDLHLETDLPYQHMSPNLHPFVWGLHYLMLDDWNLSFNTPLRWAAINNQLSVVRYLWQLNVFTPMDLLGDKHATLGFCALNGYISVLQFIHSLDIVDKDTWLRHALPYAKRYVQKKTVDFIHGILLFAHTPKKNYNTE